jgi:predicted nucleic acid-binding protein
MKNNNVLVDTNVLVNDFLARTKKESLTQDAISAHEAIAYLKRNSAVFYIASFSIMQLISTIQKRKPDIYTVSDILKEVENLSNSERYKIINVVRSDFTDCVHRIKNEKTIDIEDNMIYGLAMKTKCTFILTFDGHFHRYKTNIDIVRPTEVKNIYD